MPDPAFDTAPPDDPRQATPTFAALRDKLQYYRDEVRHEYNLLGQRMTWYITCQSFLLTAFAIASGNPSHEFRASLTAILAALGICTSLFSYPGIVAANVVIERWHRRENDVRTQAGPNSDLRDYFVDTTFNLNLLGRWQGKTDVVRSVGQGFVLLIVPAFFAAWLCLLSVRHHL